MTLSIDPPTLTDSKTWEKKLGYGGGEERLPEGMSGREWKDHQRSGRSSATKVARV
jgi:hypothetical protein